MPLYSSHLTGSYLKKTESGTIRKCGPGIMLMKPVARATYSKVEYRYRQWYFPLFKGYISRSSYLAIAMHLLYLYTIWHCCIIKLPTVIWIKGILPTTTIRNIISRLDFKFVELSTQCNNQLAIACQILAVTSLLYIVWSTCETISKFAKNFSVVASMYWSLCLVATGIHSIGYRYCLIFMHLVHVILLQVASLLLASAIDSTEAFQKHIISLQSNETTRRLEKDDLAALLEINEEIAQEQIDQLSLVTRYTGTGYNLVRGNPEGDFNRGGIDPGIRTTNEIFSHTR